MCATVSTALAKLSIKLIEMLKPNTGHHKQVYRIMVESMSGNMKCVYAIRVLLPRVTFS